MLTDFDVRAAKNSAGNWIFFEPPGGAPRVFNGHGGSVLTAHPRPPKVSGRATQTTRHCHGRRAATGIRGTPAYRDPGDKPPGCPRPSNTGIRGTNHVAVPRQPVLGFQGHPARWRTSTILGSGGHFPPGGVWPYREMEDNHRNVRDRHTGSPGIKAPGARGCPTGTRGTNAGNRGALYRDSRDKPRRKSLVGLSFFTP